MDLSFKEQNGEFISEFSVTGDFSLHIEKGFGNVSLYQKSVETGEYDFTCILSKNPTASVIDTLVPVLVPPMYLKIVSDTMPMMAVVTVGEGGEIGYSEAQIADVLNTPV